MTTTPVRVLDEKIQECLAETDPLAAISGA
jgi:hypothetical protein